MKSKLKATCSELHNLYLDYRYPVLFVSPKLVFEMRGIQQACKIMLKKAMIFFSKATSNSFWYRMPVISGFLCRRSMNWLVSLRLENRFDFQVVCNHGNHKNFEISKLESSLKKDQIVVPMSGAVPVVIYGFARPNHLRKLLDSIVNIEGYNRFHFVFFLDGPRNSREMVLANEVLEVCLKFAAVHKTIIANKLNIGLHDSVIRGLDAVFQSYKFAIVLEDDLECDPRALSWFEEQSNNLSEGDSQGGLCGYLPPVLEQIVDRSFECRRFHSWGWATWATVWNQTDFTDQRLLELVVSRASREQFLLAGPDILPIAIAQISGDIDSWAVKFTIAAITSDQKFKFPMHSLITNNGYGDEATHTGVRRDNVKNGLRKTQKIDGIDDLIRAYYA